MMYFVHNSQEWCQHITWQVLNSCEQQIGMVKLITHILVILEFHILLFVGHDLLATIQTSSMHGVGCLAVHIYYMHF